MSNTNQGRQPQLQMPCQEYALLKIEKVHHNAPHQLHNDKHGNNKHRMGKRGINS